MQTEIRNSLDLYAALRMKHSLFPCFRPSFLIFVRKKLKIRDLVRNLWAGGDQEAEMQGAPGRLPDFRARKRERFVPNSENQTSLGRARCFFHTGSMNR